MNWKQKFIISASIFSTALMSMFSLSSCKTQDICDLKPKGNWTIDPVKCEYKCELPPKTGYNIDNNCEYYCALTPLPGYEITDSCTYVAIVTQDTAKILITSIPVWQEKNPAIEALLAMPGNTVVSVTFTNINANISDLYSTATRYVTDKNSTPDGKLVDNWNDNHITPTNDQQWLTPTILGELTGTNGKLGTPFGSNDAGDKYKLESQYKDYLLSVLNNPNDTANINIVYPAPNYNFNVTDSATLRAFINQSRSLLQQQDVQINLNGNNSEIGLNASNSNLADSTASRVADPRVVTQNGAFYIKAIGYNVPVESPVTLQTLNGKNLLASMSIGGNNHFKAKNTTAGMPSIPGIVYQVNKANLSDLNLQYVIPDTTILNGILNESMIEQLYDSWQYQLVFAPGTQQTNLGSVNSTFIENASEPSIPNSTALLKFLADQIISPYGPISNTNTNYVDGHELINIDNLTLAWIIISNNVVNDDTQRPLPKENVPYRSFNLTTNNQNYMDDGKLLLNDVDFQKNYDLLCRGPTKKHLDNVKIVLTDPTLLDFYNSFGSQIVLNILNIDNTSTNVDITDEMPAGKSCFPLNNVTELLNGIPAQQSAPRRNTQSKSQTMPRTTAEINDWQKSIRSTMPEDVRKKTLTFNNAANIADATLKRQKSKDYDYNKMLAIKQRRRWNKRQQFQNVA